MQTLKAILSWLNMKKEYFLMLILAIYGVIKIYVELTPQEDIAILSLIGALFGVGVVNKVDKLGRMMGVMMGGKMGKINKKK